MQFKKVISLLVGFLMVFGSFSSVFASGGSDDDDCNDRYSVRSSGHDNGNGNSNDNGNGNGNEGNENDDNDNEGNENEGGDCEETPEPTETSSTATSVPPTATVVIIPTNTFLPPTATLEPTATSTSVPEVTVTSDPTTTTPVSPTSTAVTQSVVDSGDQSSNDAERYKAPVTGSGGNMASVALFLLGLGLIVYGLFPSLKLVKSS